MNDNQFDKKLENPDNSYNQEMKAESGSSMIGTIQAGNIVGSTIIINTGEQSITNSSQKDGAQNSKDLLNQVITFLKTIENQSSRIKLFHSNKLIKLIDQYIPINLTNKKKYNDLVEPTSGYTQSEEETRIAYAHVKTRTDENEEQPISWEEAKKLGERLIVLADPGMGKSTLLQREALVIAQSQLEFISEKSEKKDILDNILFPIFLSLKEFSESKYKAKNKNITDIIMEIISRKYSKDIVKPIAQLLKTKLKKGKCVLLLDGLDEVPKKKKLNLSKQLNGFLGNCPCKVICTSRIVGYSSFLDEAKELEIHPFFHPEIEAYVKAWFNNAREEIVDSSPEKMLAELKSKPQIQGLTQIPLILSLLCSLYQEGALTLPARKSQIYKQAVNNLLTKWVLNRDTNIDEWDIEEIKPLLNYLAYYMSCNNKQIITNHELFKLVINFTNITSNKLQHQKDPKVIVRDLTEKYGVIQNLHKDSQKYIFLHRTFQEYFTACYINEELENNRSQAETIIKDHLWNFDWHETLSLLAGIMQDNQQDPLILINLIKQEKDDIFSSMLLLAGQCISECSDLSDSTITKTIDNIYKVWFDKQFQYVQLVKNIIVSISLTNPYSLSILTSILYNKYQYINTLRNPSYSITITVDPRGNADVSLDLLEKRDLFFRIQAVQTLGAIRNKKSIDILSNILDAQDEDIEFKKLIIFILKGTNDENAISYLTKILSDPNEKPELKKTVAEVLVDITNKIPNSLLVEALTNALTNPIENIDIRINAAKCLGNLMNENSICLFTRILSTPNENVELKSNIAEILVGVTDTKFSPFLTEVFTKILNDFAEDISIRRSATYWLSNSTSQDSTACLVNVLNSGSNKNNDHIRLFVAKALGVKAIFNKTDTTSIDALIKSFSDPEQNQDFKIHVLRILSDIADTTSVDALINFLSDTQQDQHFKVHIVEALGNIFYKKPELINEKLTNALIKQLYDTQNLVSSSAANALGHIANQISIETLINSLSKPEQNTEFRSIVIEALGNIIFKNPTLIDKNLITLLINSLSDTSYNIRKNSVKALGNIAYRGSKFIDKTFIKALNGSLLDKNSEVKNATVQALSNIYNTDSIKILVDCLSDSTQEQMLKDDVVQALTRIAQKNPKLINRNSIETLINYFSESDSRVKTTILNIIGNTTNKDYIHFLENTLNDNDKDVRKSAIEALAKIVDTSSVLHLINALVNKNSDVRKVAAKAIKKVVNKDTLNMILKIHHKKIFNPEIFDLIRDLFIRCSIQTRGIEADFKPIYPEEIVD